MMLASRAILSDADLGEFCAARIVEEELREALQFATDDEEITEDRAPADRVRGRSAASCTRAIGNDQVATDLVLSCAIVVR